MTRIAKPRISRRTKVIAGGVVVAGASAVAAYALLRPKMHRWGATDDEVTSVLPGDDRVAGASYVSTLALTIDAPPATIWPWLAQMGYGRGGLYSYDWLDRAFGYLDAPSATVVLPEYQQLKAGDTIPLGRGPSWPVVEAERERTLVLEPLAGVVTWAFAIQPIDARSSRLVTRVRMRMEPSAKGRLTMLAIDPAAFIMTRRMLLGIKERSEALARSTSLGTSLGSDP
jgi:hypothetical protein